MDFEIRTARPKEIPLVKALWREYWEWLGLGGAFQGFEAEVESLPGKYELLLLAFAKGEAIATAALRPIGDGMCEAKRLYVRPSARGTGVARALLERLIADAEAAGYSAICADTMPSMIPALTLYRRAGFIDVGPYAADPTPGAVYLKRYLNPPAIAPTTK
ncbi:MAG: GNAT family N-acetyltransferase [Bryobacteraceae bacterium]